MVLGLNKDGPELKCCLFDPYTMPRVDEVMESLVKSNSLTTLNLCIGYWQVPLIESYPELSPFRVTSGLLDYTDSWSGHQSQEVPQCQVNDLVP